MRGGGVSAGYFAGLIGTGRRSRGVSEAGAVLTNIEGVINEYFLD